MSTNRRHRGVSTVGSAIVLLLLVSSSVAASDTDQTDPVDTNGRFDAVSVTLAHDAEDGRWRTRMARKWNLKDAWDRGYVLISFDTKGDATGDFYVLLRSTGQDLRAALYKDNASGKDPRLSAAKAEKFDAKTAQIDLRLQRLEIGPSRTEWFWSVQTLWTGNLCTHVCMDLVPDSGSVAQPVELAPTSTSAPENPPGAGASGPPISATPNPEDVALPALTQPALTQP